MSVAEKASKIQTLCDAECVRDGEEFVETFIIDSCVPGICRNPECDYTREVEPDCEDGWCEVCDDQSVVSGLVLLDII